MREAEWSTQSWTTLSAARRASSMRASNGVTLGHIIVMVSERSSALPIPGNRVGEADLLIAKQRNGPVGDVTLAFLPQYTRFENFEPNSKTCSP
jgi:replicative DNA helicase